jgi:Transforming growth factor beta like domain
MHEHASLRVFLAAKPLLMQRNSSGWFYFPIYHAPNDSVINSASLFFSSVSSQSHPNSRYRRSVSSGSQRTPSSTDHHHQSTRRPTAQPDVVCAADDPEPRCCRRSLWISFSEIGWDSWIVQPSGYQAYYCDGTCPVGHLTAHNYAAVRQLMIAAGVAPGQPGHRRSGFPPMRGPLCGSTRLGPLPLVLRIDGREMVALFDNMIVEQCRCV